MLERPATITSPFSGKVRVRVCGILIQDNKVLLLNHKTIGARGYLWSPPGGGVEFGETTDQALRKEFMEETNLKVKVKEYLFAHEHIDQKHHAIELFFSVEHISGELKLGTDPELSPSNQILSEAKFFTFSELQRIPSDAIHSAFSTISNLKEILSIRGLITFKDY